MPDARRPLRCTIMRRVLAPLVAALVAVVACTSPGPAPAPTSPQSSPVAVAPTVSPAAATSAIAVQPSVVVHLKTVDEFEQLKGRGQPVLLAVLDQSRGDEYPESYG